MTAPDRIEITPTIPPRYPAFPHAISLMPPGCTLSTLGDPGQRAAAIFLIDPGCANVALNDPALDNYIRARLPILVYSTRIRDLRPFLRRAESFRRRGFTVEALP